MTTDDGPAAYSLYELFRTLVERVGWPTEEEKRAALRSVNEAERMQIFGNLAGTMACDHPTDCRTPQGQCTLCGRRIEQTAAPAGRAGQVPPYRGW